MIQPPLRKIIHVDMDCFYAAVEMRDNPALADKPVAVGATPAQRGVICTANYAARRFGVRSAMPSATALRRCRNLVLLPVDMPKYKAVARRIHAIFREFTPLVEPLALDEAYLDVSGSNHCRGSATLIAQAIRQRIWDTEQLTASAGVAPNKFLAKIASGWNKPNGLFVIRPDEIADFIAQLPVNELHGVGKVTAHKLHQLQLITCSDIQKIPLAELTALFGKLGQRLHEQSHGIDERKVEPNRSRKSLSVEQTFSHNQSSLAACHTLINQLYSRLLTRIAEHAANRKIKNQYVKIKFADFSSASAEMSNDKADLDNYLRLLENICASANKPIRLLGLGVHFYIEDK